MLADIIETHTIHAACGYEPSIKRRGGKKWSQPFPPTNELFYFVKKLFNGIFFFFFFGDIN